MRLSDLKIWVHQEHLYFIHIQRVRAKLIFCSTIPSIIEIKTKINMRTKKLPKLDSVKPCPIMPPAIPSSMTCPKNQANKRFGGAVAIEKRPIINAPQVRTPTCNPKIAPFFHSWILSLSISQSSKTPNIKNDKYPTGMRAKARSTGSKNGLCCEYTEASNPACRKKSNPIMDNHANSVCLI